MNSKAMRIKLVILRKFSTCGEQ